METKTFLLTTSFYPPYHIGGDAIHVADLSQELASRGHEVHVLHSIDAYRLKSRAGACRNEDDDGIHIHPVKSPFGILSVLSAYAMGKSLRVSHKFDELVKESSPDVVHHHNISLLGIDILRKRRSYVNLHTTHDYWLLCPRNDMMREGRDICTEKSCMSCTLRSWRLWQPWRRRKHLQSVLAEVDRIIAPSRNLQSLLSEEFDNGIRQIYNFAPEPPTRTRDIDDYFLFVGVLEEHKGIGLLIDAFEEAATDMRLVVVGDGSLRDYLHKRSQATRLKDRIRIVGRVGRDALYGFYNKAIALVLPSICLENCPLVVLEALSVGTPVLGSDLGGIGEIIRLSKSGITFDCNRSQIKVSLESMASDVSRQREFSGNARESYLKWFSPSVYMKAYEDEISNFDHN